VKSKDIAIKEKSILWGNRAKMAISGKCRQKKSRLKEINPKHSRGVPENH
jgi:hypothetical protein